MGIFKLFAKDEPDPEPAEILDSLTLGQVDLALTEMDDHVGANSRRVWLLQDERDAEELWASDPGRSDDERKDSAIQIEDFDNEIDSYRGEVKWAREEKRRLRGLRFLLESKESLESMGGWMKIRQMNPAAFKKYVQDLAQMRKPSGDTYVHTGVPATRRETERQQMSPTASKIYDRLTEAAKVQKPHA